MEVSVPFSGGGYAVKINYYNRSSVSSEIQYGYREKILILLFRYYWIYNLESEKGKKFYRGFTDFYTQLRMNLVMCLDWGMLMTELMKKEIKRSNIWWVLK